MESISRRLRRLRLAQDRTLSSIARELRVPLSTYRAWEEGRAIQGEPYVELARIHQVTLTYLLTGEPAPREEAVSEALRRIDEAVKQIRRLL